MNEPKIIALYLPQFHPTPDNDEWWGKGFTEWTNVGKAKALFPGHYQPKVPADLGYYDLRLPEVREQQAQLAREAGVYGFCYYHYWFGHGKQELELPFKEVLESGKPDFPFMLCWANESWHAKFWDKDGKASSKKMLIEQKYDDDDIDPHFYHLLPAFKDPRYIKIDGCPAFMIYHPDEMPDPGKFINRWQEISRKNGLPGLTFMAYLDQFITPETIKNREDYGVKYEVVTRLQEQWYKYRGFFTRIQRGVIRKIGWPSLRRYKDYMQYLIGDECRDENVIPCVLPNWDHTPRSGRRGMVLLDSTPDLFQQHLGHAIDMVENKKNPLIFLKAWNEWGEGNYVEPDLKYGHGYLDAIRRVLDSCKKQ